MDFLCQLVAPGDFMPHGYCYLWNPGLVWLNVISDSLIALAYFTIPFALLWFVRRRRDLPFTSIFVLFGTFIVACGATHLMEVWNLWHSEYWLAGGLKAVTALVSIATAIFLARLIPKALDLPSIAQWREANAQLRKEIQERQALELNLRTSAARFREQSELLELIHDAIVVRNLKNEIVFWNRAAERLYGWQKDEVEGRLMYELLHTEFPEDLASIEAAVLEKGYWEGELKHRKRDGGTVIVSGRWALHVGENGEPVGVLESNRDLTELKDKEQRFQNLLEAAPDAMVIVDREGKIQIINAQTERLFCYSRAELVGRPIEVLVPQLFRGGASNHQDTHSRLPQAPATGAARDVHARRKNGTGFPVEISSGPLETADGTLTSMYIRDVAERKRFELRLHDTEQRFRVLVESFKDYAIVGLDPDGMVSTWNVGAERFRGYTAEEIIGQHFSRFFSPEDVASDLPGEMLRRATLEGTVEQEGWHVRKDGSRFWADVVIAALHDEAGTLTGFANITRDVTERRRLEQQLHDANDFLEQRVSARTLELAGANAELRNNQELLRMAHNVANIGTFDLHEKTDNAIWSLEMEKIYGFEPGQFDRRLATWRSLIHSDDLAQTDVDSAKAKASGTPLQTEFRIVRPDGQIRWIASRAKVFPDSSGELVRMVGVNLDITETRSRQEEITALNASLEQRVTERTAELIRTNNELESFSYSVSHDLRAPLRHIDGFARILKEEFSSELPEEGQHYLSRIVQSTTHMGHLIDDLLDLAHLGRKEISRHAVNLSDLVKQSIANLRLEQNRVIEWRMDALPEANCDPGLTKLVFTNLLSNAAKFTRRCPTAVVEVGSCHIDGIFTLFVRDNGVGFDPQYADKLFGVFQRLHRQEDFEGTGIGLATVQRIVHRHGGKIWADSSPNCGATFYFTLGSQPRVSDVPRTAEITHG